MATEVIEADPNAIKAEAFVSEILDAFSPALDTDALAGALLGKGAALLVVTNGRADAARLLRQLADRCENPEPSGTA